MFPTNPINALEARDVQKSLAEMIKVCFQLIQLTHWKREMEMKAAAAFKKLFPTNPINALEARNTCPPDCREEAGVSN